jgi:hypothetical protein
MPAPFSLRRFAIDRLTVALLALALAVLAATPGGTAPSPCPDADRSAQPPAAEAAPRVDPSMPEPRSGIDLTLRVWNLRVEFPWMRALPVSPGHHIVISLFARGPE